MADLKLTLGCNDYDRCSALNDGRVKPEGIELEITRLKPRELFPRMLERRDFDVGELSLASYASLVARGKSPFVAIPVALSKLFRHSCIYVRADAGIARPEELKGKRVGTTQYGATASVYIKGLLSDEYGVKPEDMRWFVGGLSAPTETPLIPLHLPKGVSLEFLGPAETLENMMATDRLDALFSIYFPKLFLEGSPKIARLFANFRAVEEDYYRRTKILPIMHTVAIKKEIHQRHPWVAASLYRAFVQSRDVALEPYYDTDALVVSLPFLIDHIEESRRIFGTDYWAYGLEENRPSWDALCRYVYEQGLAPKRITPDDLFVPVE